MSDETVVLEIRSDGQLLGALEIRIKVYDAAVLQREQFLEACRKCAGVLSDELEVIFREH